jgi:hypothetical protein
MVNDRRHRGWACRASVVLGASRASVTKKISFANIFLINIKIFV